jgi:hypothetical protein
MSQWLEARGRGRAGDRFPIPGLVSVGNGVNGMKRDPFLLVVQQHRALFQEAMHHHHALTREKTERYLVRHAAHIQRAISPDSASMSHQQRLLHLLLRRQGQARLVRLVHRLWRLSDQSCMRGEVVESVDPCEQLVLDVLQRGDLPKMVEHLTSHRAPEAFHFASCLGIVGTRVQKRALQTSAVHRERFSPVGRAIVQVEHLGDPMSEHGRGEQCNHGRFSLVGAHAQRHDVPGSVVQKRVNTHRHGFAIQCQGGPMTDVAMPQKAGPLRLPSKPCARTGALLHASLAQALLGQHPSHGGGFDLGSDLSQGAEIGQHQGDGHIRMLAANLAEEAANFERHASSSTAIVARAGS